MKQAMVVATALAVLTLGQALPAQADHGVNIAPLTGCLGLAEDPSAPITGLVATPQSLTADPDMVLFAHGYGHDTSSWLGHIERIASHGVVAAVINYSDNDGFPVAWGAQDLATAQRCLDDQIGGDGRRILFGVSLGGATSGVAVAETPLLWDTWFAIEPVTALYETWAAASAAAPGIPFAAKARDDIERDAGRDGDGACGFHACPDAFLRRSAVHRIDDMTGLQEVFIVHAAYDGLVPYDQGVQLAIGLQQAGIPTHFTTVLRGEEGSEQDTTVPSHALGQENAVDQAHGLSGHGSEANEDQAVMATALEQLEQFLADGTGLHGAVVDRRS